MSLRFHTGAALCTVALLAAACGGNSGTPAGETPAPAAPTAAAEPPPLPGESTISGKVSLKGEPPKMRALKMSSDPLCMPPGTVLSEQVVVGPGSSLQNVFVYVKDGLGDRTFQAPKTPVVVDQRGCQYTPHVFGVQVGQPVEIVNSDGTLHNVHAIAKANAEFNFTQPTKNTRNTRVFEKPEVMVPFRCEVHGWMASYGGVLPHPYFAVSANDGSFTIKGLPAGSYTLEAWHETLGTQTMKATVDGTGAATVDFTFAAKS